jgi:hypothetical protein
MRFQILHGLSGRLRLNLELPLRPAVDPSEVEAHLHDHARAG